jgi:hypothetical protein
VALLDPALAIYGSSGKQYKSAAKLTAPEHQEDLSYASYGDRDLTSQPWTNSYLFGREEDNSGLLGDESAALIDLDEKSRRDDSADNVNQGTPSKSGSSDSSTGAGNTPPLSRAGGPSSRQQVRDKAAERLLEDTNSQVGPIEGLEASYSHLQGEQSFHSGASSERSDRNVIKTLDFGASMDESKFGSYFDDTFEAIQSIAKATSALPSARRQLSTPPRAQPAPSTYSSSSSAAGAPPLRPPSSASPASPDLRAINSSHNKTPSRIPLPSSRPAGGSATRVSPTQERSTSKFADALRRHSDEEQAAAAAAGRNPGPLPMMPVDFALTPQAKQPQSQLYYSGGLAGSTPGSQRAAPPPTPMATPFVHRGAAGEPQGADGSGVAALATTVGLVVDEATVSSGAFDEWKEAWTPVGKKYYYNRKTRKSAWRYSRSLNIQSGF